MKNDTPFTRVPTLLVVTLLGLGALIALLTAVPAAGAQTADFSCAGLPVNEQDCQALVELYENTGGSDWAEKANWLSGSPCSAAKPWHGVTCSEDRVQSIVLTGNNLVGTLPASLLNMEKLELLHLGMNRIGGVIPEVAIENSALMGLYLNQNAFEGSIPASLAKLSNLEFLYLNGNKISGAVPADLCSLKPISHGAGGVSLDHNALANDETVSDLCLDIPDGQWRRSQTVAPVPRLKADPGTEPTTNSGEITIRWAPIAFTDGGGFYEVFMSTTSGEYGDAPAARTTSKLENSVTISGIEDGVDYFFVVRTTSFANEFNPNIVTSEFSDEITNNPVAVTLSDFQAAGQAFPTAAVASALLLLALLSAAAFSGTRR